MMCDWGLIFRLLGLTLNSCRLTVLFCSRSSTFHLRCVGHCWPYHGVIALRLTVPAEHCTVQWMHSYSLVQHQRSTFRSSIMLYFSLNVLQIKQVLPWSKSTEKQSQIIYKQNIALAAFECGSAEGNAVCVKHRKNIGRHFGLFLTFHFISFSGSFVA